MLQIFNKNRFLVDSLKGFTDIHNHILPGIDDGAKNVDESIQLIKGFGEFGVKSFICTPHIMHNYYDNTPETIKESFDNLQKEMGKKKIIDVSIDFAAEHMIDNNFENILESGKTMPLAKKYMLVEMSYLQPSINFQEAVQKVASYGYFPILAHPERYIFLHSSSKKYKEYRDNGILFQLNLLSIGGFYGKQVQKTAQKLLEEKMIDFIASDIHNLQQLSHLKELKISTKKLDRLVPIIESSIYNFG